MRLRAITVTVGLLFITIPPGVFAQSILTIAGGGTDDGRPATLAGLYPSSVAVDAAGNLYMSDGSRIRKIEAGSGIITTVAGNGSQVFSGDGGLATAAGLDSRCVTLDSAGNLYIADTYNARIRKVGAGSEIITTVAGNGSRESSGDGGAATAAGLSSPAGVALDSVGNLYIADEGSGRIRKVAAGSGIISTVAGNGSEEFSGDGFAATVAGLSIPRGVAVDSAGDLYIADYGNKRIREVAAVSGIITTVAGNGDSGGFGGDGGLATKAGLSAYGVALDSAGNLYIADTDNQRVRKVTAGSGDISTVAGNGYQGFYGDGDAATAASLFYPNGVVLDSAGNLFIADTNNRRIRKVAAGNGVITTVAGNGGFGFNGDGGPATAAGLYPSSVALDSAGNLIVADTENRRIRKVAAESGIISTVAGSGDLVRFGLGDGGPATEAILTQPTGVALDAKGNLYIADTADDRIRKVAAGNGTITTVAGNGHRGVSGDGGLATAARLAQPEGLAADAAGNLYIAELVNNRIRKVESGSGLITTVAGSGSDGFSGDGGAATAAELNHAEGLALDATGNLYIADTSNNRVRKVAAATGIITTVAGGGPGGFGGDGGPATAAGLISPYGVTLDSEGNLYVADTFDHRVRKVAAGSGIITTVAGGGSFAFEGDGGAARSAGFAFPIGVAMDSSRNLYIADRNSSRVRAVFACVTVPRPELNVPSDGVHGVSSSAKLAWKPVQGAFTYDVYLDKTNPPQTTVGSDISATSYPASNLELGATYYWKIVAKGDRFCPSPSTASSEVRSFTTADGCAPASFH